MSADTIVKPDPASVNHPGAILRDYAESVGMSPLDLAKATGIPIRSIIAIYRGEEDVDRWHAEKLAVFSRPPHFWTRLQDQYDKANDREAHENRRLGERTFVFPFDYFCERHRVVATLGHGGILGSHVDVERLDDCDALGNERWTSVDLLAPDEDGDTKVYKWLVEIMAAVVAGTKPVEIIEPSEAAETE
jgi:plasmid maintenance system antidote protein VapI